LPPPSGYCDELDHEACPHERFSGIQFSRRESFAVMRTCDCHLRCPVGGRREVPYEECLLVEAVRGLRAAMNWVPWSSGEPSAGNATARHEMAPIPRDLRQLLRELAVVAILLVGAAVGAYFASGILQVILIVLAVALFALAAWVGLMTLFFIVVVRLMRRWSNNR
jgi:hypothetical protein